MPLFSGDSSRDPTLNQNPREKDFRLLIFSETIVMPFGSFVIFIFFKKDLSSNYLKNCDSNIDKHHPSIKQRIEPLNRIFFYSMWRQSDYIF